MNTKIKNIFVIIIIAFALLAGGIFAFRKVSQAGIVINTNTSSLEAISHLKETQDALSKTFQRLSSALETQSAEDDSAGLGVSEKMKASLGGLDKLQRQNSQNLKMLSISTPLLDQLDLIVSRFQNNSNASDALSKLQEIKKQFSAKEVKAFSKPANLIIDLMVKDAKAYFKSKSPSKSSVREYTAKLKKSKAAVSDLRKNIISYVNSLDKVIREVVDATEATFSDYYMDDLSEE